MCLHSTRTLFTNQALAPAPVLFLENDVVQWMPATEQAAVSCISDQVSYSYIVYKIVY